TTLFRSPYFNGLSPSARDSGREGHLRLSTAAANPETKRPLGNSVVANAGWLSVAQVARRLLRLGVLLLVARLLGIENFGAYILLLTVVELAALISGYSYGDFLTREVAARPETAWPLAKKITQIRFAYSVPCVAIALLLLAALRFPAFVFNAVHTLWLPLFCSVLCRI